MKTKADIQCEGIQAGLTNQEIIENVRKVYPDAQSSPHTVAYYRTKLRHDPKFIAKYGNGKNVQQRPGLSPELDPDAVGATVMPPTAGGETAPLTHLRKVKYQSLNGKQKEIFNFHKLGGILADYGFSCIKLSDDWLGADFLACHINGIAIMKVQLKSRLTIDEKYVGKNVYIAFPANDHWYVVPHDLLVEKVTDTSSRWVNSKSWIDNRLYHSDHPGAALLQSLSEYRLDSGTPAPRPWEEEPAPKETKRRKWFTKRL